MKPPFSQWSRKPILKFQGVKIPPFDHSMTSQSNPLGFINNVAVYYSNRAGTLNISSVIVGKVDRQEPNFSRAWLLHLTGDMDKFMCVGGQNLLARLTNKVEQTIYGYGRGNAAPTGFLSSIIYIMVHITLLHSAPSVYYRMTRPADDVKMVFPLFQSATFSDLYLAPGQRSRTCQLTPIGVHASLLGTYRPFLRHTWILEPPGYLRQRPEGSP